MKHPIRELEEKLLRPDIRQSAVELGALLADSFIEVGSNASIYDKKSTIEGLLQESPLVRWSLSDFQAQELSPQFVLATYLAAKTEHPEARPVLSRRSSLWQLINGRWCMVFHQGTPIGG